MLHYGIFRIRSCHHWKPLKMFNRFSKKYIQFLVLFFPLVFAPSIVNETSLRGRRGDSWSERSSSERGHCVVFLGKTRNSHSASLRPGVQMSTGKLLGKPNILRGMTCRTSILSRESRNTPSHFMLQKPGISSGIYEPGGSKASFFSFFILLMFINF